MRHWIFEQFGKLIAESSKIMLEERTDKNKIGSIKESASLKQTTKKKRASTGCISQHITH